MGERASSIEKHAFAHLNLGVRFPLHQHGKWIPPGGKAVGRLGRSD